MRGCVFDFSVEVLEPDFSRITISLRGALTSSFEDLEASGWKIDAHL